MSKYGSISRRTRRCLVMLLTGFSLAAGQKADFIIIDNPPALTILNRFQQRLTPADLRGLGSPVPFRVVKLDETLGDELTRAHRVSFRDQTYFLVLDEQGLPRGWAGDGPFLVLASCTVLEDTIRVKPGQRLAVRVGSPAGGERHYLAAGQQALRYFRYQGQYYLGPLKPGGPSGWSQLEPVAAWEKVVPQPVSVPAVLGRPLQQRLTERFQSVNQAYRQYFDHFNRATGVKRTAPQWECRGSEQEFTGSFRGTAADFAALSASTQALVRELEQILLGRPFRVSLQNRTVRIQSHQEK